MSQKESDLDLRSKAKFLILAMGEEKIKKRKKKIKHFSAMKTEFI